MFAGGSFLGGLAQGQTIGEVGTIDIPRNEFLSRYQSEAEDYRRRAGVDDIPPEIAQRISGSVRSDLLSYYLMKAALEQKGIRAPDDAVAAEIRDTPDFQDEDGNFSPELYSDYVSDFRYYQEQVRESIGREPVFRAMQPLPQDHIRDALAAFRRQERVVDRAILLVSDITAVTLNVPTDDINLYYQRNAGDYQLREEADFEYFIFSQDDFAVTFAVTEADIQTAYDDYTAEQTGLDKRRAAHIYLDDLLEAARIATLAIAEPARFAELAAQYSQDPGSADLGGDLGIVADGDLPASLNDAAFTMTVGQVSGPYETEEGGFSILKLNAILQTPLPPLADIRAEMTRRARRLAAVDAYDAKLEEIRDLAPLEIGSLDALASLAATTVAAAATVYSDSADNRYPFTEDSALVDAFDPIVTNSGENSAPIPLENGDYLFVRAPRYQAAGLTPLAEVEGEIIRILRAGYLTNELYTQLENLDAPVNLSLDAASLAQNTAPSNSDVILQDILDDMEWQSVHTLALAGADEGGADSIAGDDDSSLDFADNPDDPNSDIEDFEIDRLFAADLSNGLPAYVFIPREGEIIFYRVREITDHAPQSSDYAVIDELTSDMHARLTGAGYLDDLAGAYDYEFYNLPEIVNQ